MRENMDQKIKRKKEVHADRKVRKRKEEGEKSGIKMDKGDHPSVSTRLQRYVQCRSNYTTGWKNTNDIQIYTP